MSRRPFIASSALAATVGPLIADGSAVAASTSKFALSEPPAILMPYSAEDHRRRLANIAFCRRWIRTFLKLHLITNYLPGQCCYNFAEYPLENAWSPSEQALNALRENGIRLIQVYDEWMDSQRLYDGHRHPFASSCSFRSLCIVIL